MLSNMNQKKNHLLVKRKIQGREVTQKEYDVND